MEIEICAERERLAIFINDAESITIYQGDHLVAIELDQIDSLCQALKYLRDTMLEENK